MSVGVTVDLDGPLGIIEDVVRQLDGPEAEGLLRIGATAARSALREYHTDFESARKWTNPALSTHGPGRQKTRFGEEIALGWEVGKGSRKRIEVVNSAPFFAQKVTGGTITAKRVRALTIPLIPQAHGRTAAMYERVTGRKLFTVRGKKALFENYNGRLRAVYALKKSVYQKPWPGALPKEDTYLIPFIEAIEREIFQALA